MTGNMSENNPAPPESGQADGAARRTMGKRAGSRRNATSEPTLWWSRILGALCVTAAGAHASFFSQISVAGVGAGAFGPVLALVLGVLFAASAGGLLFGRGWGFFCFYALVAVATIFATLSLVPFLTDILPQPLRGWGMLLCNVLLFGFAVRLHRARRSVVAA